MKMQRRTSAASAVVALGLVIAGLVVPASAAAAADVSTFVVTNDGAGTECTVAAPCSIEAAQGRVREFLEQNTTDDVVVSLSAGLYELDSTLDLTAADTGTADQQVTWKAEGDVTFSGGESLTGWVLSDPEKSIWTAPYDGPARQLWIDGERGMLASSEYVADASICSNADCAWTPEGLKGPGVAAIGALGDISQLEITREVRWKDYQCAVERIDGDLLVMQQPCWKNTGASDRIHPDWRGASWQRGWVSGGITMLRNAPALLDSPGEFYSDGETISYIPVEGQDMSTAEVIVPRLEQLVHAESTTNLRFDGIRFSYSTFLRPGEAEGYAATQAGFTLTGENGPVPDNAAAFQTPMAVAVEALDSDGVAFVNTTFTRIGSAGLRIAHGTSGAIVSGSTFTDLSGGAIYLGDPGHAPVSGQEQVGNALTENLVSDVGIEYKDNPGIWVGNEIDLVVDHNTIEKVPYSGLSVGWGWTSTGRVNVAKNNTITANRITDVMMPATGMHDGGAIYTTNNLNGSVISRNYLSDIGNNANGVYLDAGTDNVDVTDNVIVRFGSGKWVSANLDSLHTGLYAGGNWSDASYYSFDGPNDGTVGADSELGENHLDLLALPQAALDVARQAGVNAPNEVAQLVPNWAAHGTASQSSTLRLSNGTTYPAELAIDNNTGNFAHTADGEDQWWQVALSQQVNVQRVEIWNRTSNQDRLTNMSLVLSRTPIIGTTFEEITQGAGVTVLPIEGQVGRPTTIDVDIDATYVMLLHDGPGQLNIAEVRVYGAAVEEHIDEVKPVATLVTPSTGGPLRGLQLRVDATDDRGLSKIVANVYQNGTLVKSTQSVVDGAMSASHTADVTLPDGSYSIKFNAHDLAGNVSQTGQFALTIDTTAPEATIKDGENFTVKTGETYDVVSFKLYDAHKIDRVEVNGQVKDLSDNTWSDVNFIAPGVFGAVRGENTLVVYDIAGNSQNYVFSLN